MDTQNGIYKTFKKIKVKDCKVVFDALLQGCGLTKEDINKTDYDYGWSDCAVLEYTRNEDYISIECDMVSLINLMSSINYELLYCDYETLRIIENCWGLPNEQYRQFVNDHMLQMIFHGKGSDSNKLVVFELDGDCDTLTHHIERAIFSDKDGDTVLFEENKGFNTLFVQTQEQSNTTTTDLETRVNNIEEKLDTLIKMISK